MADTDLRLSQLDDYEVDEGYPDIRGWPARGSNGLELGTVGDLLVDTELLEVSAVDLHLGVGAAGVRGNVVSSSRVPIEAVRIQPDRYVIVDVEAIPCEDVLLEPSADGAVAARRVPCGQIGIRRLGERVVRGLEVDVTPPPVDDTTGYVVSDRIPPASDDRDARR